MDEYVKELVKDVDFEYYMKKNVGNGIYLSDEEVSILNMYNIDYKNVKDINELIYKIDEYLEEEDIEELEWLASNLAETNYYQNTNK